MKKYLIEPRPTLKLSKPICSARGDASAILTGVGYELLYLPRKSGGGLIIKLLHMLQFVLDCLKIAFKVSQKDIVFMQWPESNRLFKLLYLVLKSRRPSLCLLVHDIDKLRGGVTRCEPEIFRLASRIILHSEQMKEVIKETYGVADERMVVLQSFDYLTKDEITRPIQKSKDVVFVGQLDKSSFLEQISPAHLGIHINLYGRYEKDLGPDVSYKCKFRPDNVSVFEGSWGLVWNGDTIDECTGPMGEYLRYNAPHKLSLFTVAYLPIIIWDKAAKADYVKEKGLGICVSSLREISQRIDDITEDEYLQMVENVKRESASMREGEHLLECLP